MEAVAVRKKAIDLIERLPDDDVRLVVRYASSLYEKNYREAEKKRSLMELFGSVQDESFVRPEQLPLEYL
ncbi:MAG: hypothetical protein J6Y13_10740 [Treponema sp.]|nr:hypothetical protein [Treponema sp.]